MAFFSAIVFKISPRKGKNYGLDYHRLSKLESVRQDHHMTKQNHPLNPFQDGFNSSLMTNFNKVQVALEFWYFPIFDKILDSNGSIPLRKHVLGVIEAIDTILRLLAFYSYLKQGLGISSSENNRENLPDFGKREKIQKNVKKKDISPGNCPIKKSLHTKLLLDTKNNCIRVRRKYTFFSEFKRALKFH